MFSDFFAKINGIEIKNKENNFVGVIGALTTGLQEAQKQELGLDGAVQFAKSASVLGGSEFCPEFPVEGGSVPHWNGKTAVEVKFVPSFTDVEEWGDEDGNTVEIEVFHPQKWIVSWKIFNSEGQIFRQVRSKSFENLEMAKAYFASFWA